jgi:hypothetical protein
MVTSSAGLGAESDSAGNAQASKLQTRPLFREGVCNMKSSNVKSWGFHGGDYEELCLLGCYAVWLL